MIRRIVIPVRGDGKGDNVFAHAVAVAGRFDAQVVVTHCRARAEDMMPYGVPIPASMKKLLLSQSAELADQVEDNLKKELEVLAKRLNIDIVEGYVAGKSSATWVEEQGRQVDVIKRHGRLADLICVAKPDVDRNLGANTLKAALFNTGRPVMMCPGSESFPESLCDRIAIAWNGSMEASRAVALSGPILERASQVSILCSGPEVDGAGADALKEFLRIRGIQAEINRFDAKRKIGQALLSESVSAGADTLIMGAYSNSHERETVFGGTTQYIVDKAQSPVIFVH
ncbi:MAG: universal stress protein [Granulosicoccus sp.]